MEREMPFTRRYFTLKVLKLLDNKLSNIPQMKMTNPKRDICKGRSRLIKGKVNRQEVNSLKNRKKE